MSRNRSGRLPEPAANRHQELARPGRVTHEARQQLGRHLLGHLRLARPAQRHDRAAGVDEGPERVEGKEGAVVRVEQQHRGAVVHRHVPEQAHLAALHLRAVEDRGEGARLPRCGVQQDVFHGCGFLTAPKPKRGRIVPFACSRHSLM